VLFAERTLTRPHDRQFTVALNKCGEGTLDSAQKHARKTLIGARLESVQRLDHDWDFRFEAGSLMVQSLWRLVSKAHMEATSEDDGQQFGLKTPVNAAELLKATIGEKRISDVRIDDATSDLTFYFGQSLRFEVISSSAGYEAWSLHMKEVQIIGRNGDRVVFSSPKQAP
jgi:hypothetical protein